MTQVTPADLLRTREQVARNRMKAQAEQFAATLKFNFDLIAVMSLRELQNRVGSENCEDFLKQLKEYGFEITRFAHMLRITVSEEVRQLVQSGGSKEELKFAIAACQKAQRYSQLDGCEVESKAAELILSMDTADNQYWTRGFLESRLGKDDLKAVLENLKKAFGIEIEPYFKDTEGQFQDADAYFVSWPSHEIWEKALQKVCSQIQECRLKLPARQKQFWRAFLYNSRKVFRKTKNYKKSKIDDEFKKLMQQNM